jgi:hypothetical protein
MWQRAAAGIALLVAMGGGAAAQGQLVIAKEGTGFYHWPGCPVVKDGEGVIAMNRGQAELRGLKPHPDCDPSKPPAPPAAAPGGTGPRTRTLSKPAAPPSVFVDAAEKYYHRERCARLVGTPKKVLLDGSTARKYWPCPRCRPPIRPKKG